MSFKVFGVGFGKPEEIGGDIQNESLHSEKTQKVNPKPRLEELERGFVGCYNCGASMPLNTLAPLNLHRCCDCSSIFFVPMKIKNYWLYEPIGGGGMGSVYHAFHERNPSAEFAIKILPRNRKNDAELIETLIGEAEIGSIFGDHPHVSKVYEYGCFDGEHFAAYEYIEGLRLDRIIESPVRRTDKEILLWALQILSAEQHMFDHGYLFRDLKPQNVIIDGKGNVKLIDFGLAMKVEDAKAKGNSNAITGSPYYMPPERIAGHPEGQYSEIYSLGMLLYHMIAGQTYYSTEDINSLIEKHIMSPQMLNIAVKLPVNTNLDLIDALEKMIVRSPQKRFQTYKETGSILFNIYKACA
jgi:serine/threonine-protein kinase